MFSGIKKTGKPKVMPLEMQIIVSALLYPKRSPDSGRVHFELMLTIVTLA